MMKAGSDKARTISVYPSIHFELSCRVEAKSRERDDSAQGFTGRVQRKPSSLDSSSKRAARARAPRLVDFFFVNLLCRNPELS